MPRNTPTLAEIAADYALWGKYFDIDGLDSPKQWARKSFAYRLEMLRRSFAGEPCVECGRIMHNLDGLDGEACAECRSN